MSAASMSSGLMETLTKWERSVEGLSNRHWASGSGDQSASHFSNPPDHDPQVERIKRHQIHGETAIIETESRQASFPTFFEYHLKVVDGGWRITSMTSFFDDENEPAFSEGDMNSLFKKVSSSPDLPPHEKGDEPNCEVLFDAGRVVKGTLMQQPDSIRIHRPGKLSLPSGMIIVRDFGYSPEDALPLSLKVPPGDYEIEACLLDGRVAAIRVLFSSSKEPPLTYRQAVTVEDGSSVIGVDAGNVAICDAGVFMRRTKRNHERDYQAWVEKTNNRTGGTEDVTLLSLAGSTTNTALVSGSGYGDGGYPSYWVFDGQNNLVALVVDFQVAAEQLYRTVRLPWKAGVSGVIHEEPGLVVEVDRDSGLNLKGENVSEARWMDDKEGLVANSHQFQSSYSSNEERTYYLDFAKLDGKAVTLEIQIYTGFRNNR